MYDFRIELVKLLTLTGLKFALAKKYLVRTKCVRTHIVRVRADVVASKLGIILPFFFFFHILFSQKGFAYEVEIRGVT